ncbi:hypothetical protein H0H87_000048 [Tephrocybe sp. NHM501043]|nr:hypothetical protein H0H87_000048 [Tephrocybe sp. NHM501043]
MQTICRGPSADSEKSRRMISAIKSVVRRTFEDRLSHLDFMDVQHNDLTNADQITNYFGNLPALFVEKNEDEPPVLMRRSIFGYFTRRCFVSFIKLSFSGVVKLQMDYQSWCLGDVCAGYETIVKDQLSNSELLIFKTQADKKSWAKPDSYEAWEKGNLTGDENIATEHLRRFFEQHFHESNDSGVRQHALLNMARMHYLRNEVTAARKDQPMSAAFSKISEAAGLYDNWLEAQGAPLLEEEQWASHAVQSVVWDAIGCVQVASLEESILLAFTQPGTEDHNRITMLLNRSYHKARQGLYHEAIAMLMEPDVWRGLTMSDYAAWANEIWHILALRATRRGQDRLFREYLVPRRPLGDYNPRAYTHDSRSSLVDKIRDPLYDVIELRRCDQATSSIEQLLKSLWQSEFLTRFNDYRTGVILLADITIEFHLPKRSQKILEEIMPQIINGNDLEQRAFACFTLARSMIASGGSADAVLADALPYVKMAEDDYKTLEINASLVHVQYLLSVIYHNLGMSEDRDAAANRHFQTLELQKKQGTVVVEDDTQRVLEVVELGMDGPPPQEEDFSLLPITDRIAHKNWKARVSAYEALVKTFQTTASDTDPAFKPYINNPDLLKKIATDSNAVAQEKGVECLVALVKFAGETAAKTREAVMPALVDKCFGSTRAGTKSQALELTLQYVEVENGGAGVVADILPGLGAKQPKSVAGCVIVLKEIIRYVTVRLRSMFHVLACHTRRGPNLTGTNSVFGVQVMPVPQLLKALPKIFSHSDKTVRAEGTTLTHVLYQYLGTGIEPWLAELKPVQVKELKEAFESMENDGKGKGTLKPDRLTRQQAREAEIFEANDEQTSDIPGAEPEEINLDPRALAEPVDIVSKLSPSLQTALKSSKWKERKEALDELLTLLASTPRMKDAPELGELAKSLASRVSGDANINCVMVASSCIEELAKGLMTAFGKYREGVVPLMLERLKERKATVTDAIGNALDAVFATTTLSDVIPDLEPAMKSKNPQVKEGTLKFFSRCLATSPSPIPPVQVKPISDLLANLLEDGFEGARNEAATCLGTLMKMVGERPLTAVMDALADVRKAKVKEAYEKASVKCTAAKAGVSKPVAQKPPVQQPVKATSPKKAPVSKPTIEENDALIVKEPAPKPPPKAIKKPPTLSSSAPKKPTPAVAPPKNAKPASAVPNSALDAFKYKHTPEDAELLASETLPASMISGLGDGNWKTRLAALEELTTWVDREVDTLDAEVLVRALSKKCWNEKNFQVSTKVYAILGLLAEKCPTFGRSCPALSIGHLTEKLGDMKLKKPAGDTLLIFAERTSLQFVLNQAYEPLSKQKAPKVLADAITWINTALTEFGIAGLALRSLIDFLKSALQNSNATVRTSATKTLVTVKLFAGSSIKDFLEDLNPQLLNTITSEFDKVEGTPAPEPNRSSADLAMISSAPGSGGKAQQGDPLDDLFPRVELDGLLKGTSILADAKNDAWKTRKEALETLQAILDQGSNKRLKGSMGEIGQVLKARLADQNKAVQTSALDIISRISLGMGKPFEKHARLFTAPICAVLADQKAPIRAAALQVLTSIATACEGIDAMVPGMATAMEATNPMQKGALFGWLADWFKDHPPSSSLDLKSWAPPVIASLDDRSSDVRKGAQTLLPTLISCAGFDFVLHQTNSLKPASRASAVPLIQAARQEAQPATSGPAPLSKAASTSPPAAITPAASRNPPPESPPPSNVPPITKPKLGVRGLLPQRTARPESRLETPVEGPVSSRTKPAVGGLKGNTPTGGPLSPSPAPPLVFFGNNLDAKRARCGKDAQKWINEGGPTRKDLADLLQSQMEPHASKELVSRLFSHDHNAVNDHVNGLGTMSDFYLNAQNADENVETVCLANLDLPLKYVSIKAHEPQPNLISKCLDVVEAVLAFLRTVNYQLTDGEALCFIPTMIFKLGDAREQVRGRVQQIIRMLPKVYAYSRVFQLLLDYGLKSKVAKARQGALDEIAGILKKSGMGACEPSKAFPTIASMISDKDSAVRKSALGALSEAFTLVGEKVWSLVGPLPPKDKTQLEERLRRVPGPSSHDKQDVTSLPASSIVAPAITRAAAGTVRPGSPLVSRIAALHRPASPALLPGASRLARAASPAHTVRSRSPTASSAGRSESPVRASQIPQALDNSSVVIPGSPKGIARPKSLLPSKLGRPRPTFSAPLSQPAMREEAIMDEPAPSYGSNDQEPSPMVKEPELAMHTPPSEDIAITISSILSSDATRSVDALKKIQMILSVGPEDGPESIPYRELADHAEGLIETITLQMAHVFERPENLVPDENFRLAKHLIQTLNNFCDHALLAETLTVDILTSLLEELTIRLLETDVSPVNKVKDLSRFINMIILRLFATGRRMSIFRALFALLLQIVKPFPGNGTPPESKEAKVAELILKCVWKLARNIPQDLGELKLDPVELFPAIEHFLQSVPPNEWRARATNKVPCGDMPLRTIKVIIQHVVAHYGDDVYDLLSAAFDDPSATIVYPYVYRILNSSSRPGADPRNGGSTEQATQPVSPTSSRPLSPQGTTSSANSVAHRRSPSHRTSPSSSSANGNTGFSPAIEEPDPEAQLLVIIGHISSETTGALHKEGITELHHFLKQYPHKKPRVDKLLESTGTAFRKYISRALASRAAEDVERDAAVTDTLTIPVARAADYASPATGHIYLSPDDPCLVLGEETKFLSELKPRMQILLSKALGSLVAEVSEVISDTELRIKREFGGESGKGSSKIRERVSELRKDDIKGLDFKKMPFVDQQEMYRHVYECLNEGGSIGIFPEGGSHDRTDLLPLKAGVSVMALGAMANDPNVRVKIVPVGLSYFHAHRFRSRAVVEFGSALDVPPEYVEMFKEGGVRKREAVAQFLNLIYDALKTVTIRAPDYDTLMLIQAVRRLYKTPGQHLTLGQVVELNKRLLEGYVHFKDEPRVQKLRSGVLKYNRLVRDLGLRDHQAFWTILSLPGTILNGPMFILASLISRKKAKEALAASVVKIAGRDVLATWKVLISLGVAPLLYTFYAFLATYIAIRAKASISWRIATPFLVFVALPFMNYAALKFGEAGMDVLKSLRPLVVALVPGQQRSLDQLKRLREELSNEVADLINDFGPKLYEDFDEWRILVPSASAPPSTGTPGLWRRKSSTGAVDAQGLGLTHPMTWIDERLFGWSRSAKRGTSAWNGFSGDESSRIGTPDESDDEDTGDYDNVVGMIPSTDELMVNQKPKSRQSSFADLQRLRGLSTISNEGVYSRQGHRVRKESLSDSVTVERLAAVNRAEPFPNATLDLNDEINRNRSKNGRGD